MPAATVSLHDKTFVPFIEAERLARRVAELGAQISADYAHLAEPLLVVPVLSGSFVFAADLVRHLAVPCQIEFIRVASYAGTGSTGAVQQVLGLASPLAGRHVLLVEDIVDTGLTMHHLLGQFGAQGPASVRVATLLSKPESLQQPVPLAYAGFEIGPEFVVGYGLDYNGLGRELPQVYVLQP